MAEGRKKILPQPLPIELIEEILSRVRATSLLRFRCVSKSWYALIRDPYFIMKQLRNNNRNNTRSITLYSAIKVRYNLTFHFGATLECREMLELPEINEEIVEKVQYPDVMGICNGIIYLCYWTYTPYVSYFVCVGAFLWNPVTKQVKALPEPSIFSGQSALERFGFDETTNDYKVLRLLPSTRPGVGMRAEMYSLRADCWRIMLVPQELHGASIRGWSHSYANGCLFFEVRPAPNNRKIGLFDMKNEEFRLIDFPIHHVKLFDLKYEITKWKDDSCVAYVEISSEYRMEMWVMERFGKAGSCWVKHFSVPSLIPSPTPQTRYEFRGFLSTSEILIAIENRRGDDEIYLGYRRSVDEISELAIYSIAAQSITPITAPLVRSSYTYFVEVYPCYKESLVSLSSDDYA